MQGPDRVRREQQHHLGELGMEVTFASRMNSVGLSMIRQIMQKAQNCTNLGIGEPQFLTPAVARQAAQKFIEGGSVLYTPNAGIGKLCEAIIRYHRCPLGYRACVTNGSQEALFNLLFSIIDVGDEVLLPDPGYPAYTTIVEMAGGIPVTYPLRVESSFQIDTPNISSLFNKKTKAIIVNSPSNPTGQVLTDTSLEQLSALLEEHHTIAISDEIYSELYYNGKRPPSLSQHYPNTVILSGISKMASMTGWRIGWACGPESLLSKVVVMHQYTSSCASSLGQEAALAVLTPEGMSAVTRRRQILTENRDRVVKWATNNWNHRTHAPQGAFYFMLPVSHLRRSSLEVASELLKDQVATIPGGAFGSQGEGFLRISFANKPEELNLGLSRLKRGLYRLQRNLP